MLDAREKRTFGCLLLDDAKPGSASLSGLCVSLERRGMRARAFGSLCGVDLWGRLQEAYYLARSGCSGQGIIGRGAGCWAALALAEQLPVDRLALIDLDASPGFGRGVSREITRLRAFTLRNLAFCTCDVLLTCADAETLRRASRRLRGLRGRRFVCRTEPEWLTKPGESAAHLLSLFLQAGELPKSLAENPEMCIIYG